MNYSSSFTMGKPPLLLAWASAELVSKCDCEKVLASPELKKLGLVESEKLSRPHILEHGGSEKGGIIRSTDVRLSDDKRTGVAISSRDIYYFTTNYSSFDDFGSQLQQVFGAVNKHSDRQEFVGCELSFYNVWETEGSTTDLLKSDVQGPKPRVAHEHRHFQHSMLIENPKTWVTTIARFLHGNSFRPSIRNGLEKLISFDAGFNPVFESDAFSLKLSAEKVGRLPFQGLESFWVDAKQRIDDKFLQTVSEEGKKQWQLKQSN